MAYIPSGSTKHQIALLALLIPGDVCAYYNIGGDDYKKAVMLIHQYCALPELGRSWRGQVQFTPPPAQGGTKPGASATGAAPGSPFSGPFGYNNPFGNPFGSPFGYGGAFAQPNNLELRTAVIKFLSILFLDPEGPFTMIKPLPIRQSNARLVGANLKDLVECWRIVEREFGLPSMPYDVRGS
jgi:hypothetical protein